MRRGRYYFIFIYTRALLFYLVGAAWMRSGSTKAKMRLAKYLALLIPTKLYFKLCNNALREFCVPAVMQRAARTFLMMELKGKEEVYETTEREQKQRKAEEERKEECQPACHNTNQRRNEKHFSFLPAAALWQAIKNYFNQQTFVPALRLLICLRYTAGR